MERAPAGNLRIITAGHNAGSGGVSVQHGDASHHALGRGELGFTAKRHHNRATANGAVKALRKTLFAAHVQTAQIL